MQRRTRHACLGLCPWLIALLVGIGASSPARADGEHASRWIDKDAVIYIEILAPAKVEDQVLGASFQKALQAFPQYANYRRSDSFAHVQNALDTIARRLDTTPEKGLRALTGGGIVLAVDGEPGKPGRVVVIVTPTDPELLERANDVLLELARKDAADNGKPDPVKSTEYRGIRAYGGGKEAYAIVGGRLVIANRGEALKAVIDRMKDGDKAGPSIADNDRWKQERAKVSPDAVAWAFARLDRLRELDKKFAFEGETPPHLTLFFGAWVDALRKADWASASLTWDDQGLGVELSLPTPPGGHRDAVKGFVPPRGKGAKPPANPPGTVASVSLWRDLSRIWEARADLFTPEVVQGFAKLDGVAGQFFGGRDFGTGVLGSLADEWRLVVALQDYDSMKPVPETKLPAFALVVDLKPSEDDDFAQRLKVAFQSFIGLANLGAAQQMAPPLELGNETFEGVTIATSKFMLPKVPPDPKQPVNQRHNFSPSSAQVGDHYILSSSIGLARDLVRSLKAPAGDSDATLVAEADGAGLARLVDLNKQRLVMQNMLEKGHDKAQAETEVGLLAHLLRYLGHARLSVKDAPDTLRLNLSFALSK